MNHVATQRDRERRQRRQDVHRPLAPGRREEPQAPQGREQEQAQRRRSLERRAGRAVGERSGERDKEQRPGEQADQQARDVEPEWLGVVERGDVADHVVLPEECQGLLGPVPGEDHIPGQGEGQHHGQEDGPRPQRQPRRAAVEQLERQDRHRDQHQGDRPLGEYAESAGRRRRQPPAAAQARPAHCPVGGEQRGRHAQAEYAVQRQHASEVHEAAHDRQRTTALTDRAAVVPRGRLPHRYASRTASTPAAPGTTRAAQSWTPKRV